MIIENQSLRKNNFESSIQYIVKEPFKYDGKIMQFADFNKTIRELISVGVHSLPKHSCSSVCFLDTCNEILFTCYLRHKHRMGSVN